jgi:hypothetical protein
VVVSCTVPVDDLKVCIPVYLRGIYSIEAEQAQALEAHESKSAVDVGMSEFLSRKGQNEPPDRGE